MHKLWTVIKFTFLTQIRQKSFLISTLVFVAILSVMVHLPTIIDTFSGDEGPKRIGLVSGGERYVSLMNEFYAASGDPEVVIVGAPTEEEAERRVEAKELEGYLAATNDANPNGVPGFEYRSKEAMPTLLGDVARGLQHVSQTLARESIGLTDEQAARLSAPVSVVPVQLIDGGGAGKSESEVQLAFGLVYVLLFLLYMGVIGYGNTVATSITAEKSSRVMELLVSSVSPLTQMFGKIIGICLIGLTQIVLFIAVGAANLAATQESNPMLAEMNIRLSDVDPMLLVYFVVFYLLGYLIYAAVFAAVGSLVSRTEEVGQVIMPVTLLIVIAFVVAMYGLSNPNATLIVVLSFVPFFSPLVMFLRIGLADPAWWEIALSIAISAAGVYAMGWLAAKIYRTGVLMYGKLPTWKELRKAMKAMDV
ncbi:ABC transporter permease [Paenibacillus sp.]|uniref:ABC transporter permease n=1 Tax=Paenibacillus sp. TaxID=58172 RepID=UPI002D30A543|nr:ABC transporter permease [Paenibacillus sp.]HZG55748.1 ABC transporter permease [Paenibacillus sp.]